MLEIPVCFLHYDPEHWPEPEKFIPERYKALFTVYKKNYGARYLFDYHPNLVNGLTLFANKFVKSILLVLTDSSRFTPEAKASRHPFVYLPFGAGPRNCIGMRLAKLEIKMALVQLFRRFSIVASSETEVSLTPLTPFTLHTCTWKNWLFLTTETEPILVAQVKMEKYLWGQSYWGNSSVAHQHLYLFKWDHWLNSNQILKY